MKQFFFLITLLFSLSSVPLPAALSPEEFRNPPMEARPMALWTWLNGYVDRQQITRELEEMKAKGMRGGVIWDLGSIADPQKMIPAGPEFLGEESLKSIHHAMDEAQRLGLELGLVASSSWNAGGTWIKPENASKALLWSELRVEGPKEFSEVLPLPQKVTAHHQTVAVWAVPDAADKAISPAAAVRLDPKVDEAGRLTWSVPEGAWRLLHFVSNNTGELLNCPSPNSRGLVIDHLSGPAMDAHFHHMLDALSKGREGFGSLKMLMLDSYEVRPANDWTPEFLQSFQNRNGYDAAPWLPVLAGWTVGNKELSDRFRHDYSKMVSDLMIDGHFARSREILHKRGLQLLAEGGHGGYVRVDPLKALGAADIPMGEFWNHRKNWVTKEAASAAHIYGKKFVNSESFTGWQNWQDGPAAYKRLFDIALCAGLNQVTFHTFAHNPPEAGLPGFAYHAGEHFNVNATWWDQAGPMLADMSRACYLMQQGRFVADVCAYYGDDAPNLVPARRLPPTIENPYPEGKCQHCGRDFPVDLRSLGQGYDYDYINEEVLLTRMKVENGRLVLPDGMSYRVMVLPERKSISLEALQRIGELVEAGATIVGTKPERSNSLCGFPDNDRAIKELADKIWGTNAEKKSHSYGKGKVIWSTPLREVMQGMSITPDFIVEDIDNADQHIDYIHRATADEDIYFVSNSAMKREIVRCRFRVDADRVPSFWNSEHGSITPCHVYEIKDGSTLITLDLAPASSVFVVFRKGEKQDPIVKIERNDLAQDVASELEVLAKDDKKITARVWRAGEYRYQTASGRSGKISVSQVPQEQAIANPWTVTFPPDRGAPPSITMATLTDWSKHADPGVQYFSGTARYENTFTLAAVPESNIQLMLDLGSVKDIAVVRVNGKEVGTLWKEPYQIDITAHVQTGENKLEISIVNTWNNRIIGDLRSPEQKPITRTNLVGKFRPNMPLLSSGLLGPVVLRSPVIATSSEE